MSAVRNTPRAEKAVLPRHLRPHATFGDDPSGWCGCADCEPSDGCGCPSCQEVMSDDDGNPSVRDPRSCPPDGGCGGCGNWPEHCVCPPSESPISPAGGAS